MRENEPSNDDRRLGRRDFLGLGRPSQGRRCSAARAARPTSLYPSPTSGAGPASAISSIWSRTSFTSRRSCSPRTRGRSARRSRPIVGSSTTNPVDYLHDHGAAPRSRALALPPGRTCAASGDEIALTDSTTMGLGLLYRRIASAGRGGDPDDRARPLRHARGAAAAAREDRHRDPRRVSLYDDPATASRERDRRRLDRRAITPRDARGRGDVGALRRRA